MADVFFRNDGLGTPRGGRNNPFRTYSNWVYPRTVQEVQIWAAWFYERNAKYRTLINKVCDYFLAGIKVESVGSQDSVDTDEVKNFKDSLEKTYDILELTHKMGVELASMGNVFVSCERIFSRMLLCPKCSWQMALKQLHKGRDYTWDSGKFKGTCPQCHSDVVFKIKDVPSQSHDGKKLRFIFRDPRAMSVQLNQLTGTYKYYYKMPDYIKDAIKRGDEVYLQDTPKVFLDAADQDTYIAFPEDMFFSAKTDTLTVMDKLLKGWGQPLFMPAFDLFIQMAQVEKFGEAVAMDFIRPMRIISPDASNLKAGVDDPNRMPMSGSTFRNFMLSSLNKVKSNDTTYIVSPVPVNAQMVGGEAKELAPVNLLEWYADQIMQDLGIPMEFKQSSFQVVAPSMGLRMFERQWVMFAKSLHKFTNWVGNKVCDVDNIENMRVDLDITSFVEDDMNKQVRLQLMQAGVISKTEVLQGLGVDFQKDLDQRMQEQKAEQEAAMDMQTQDEGAQMVQSVLPPPGSLGVGQAQMAIQATQGGGEGQPATPGAPAAPAMPAGPGAAPMDGGQPGTPEQMWEEANNMAQQLYNAPPNVRRSQLVTLKANNPQMHSFVKSILEQMEQQVSSDAVAQSKMPQG